MCGDGIEHDFPNNNQRLRDELRSLGRGNIIADPYCPFCRGIGIISIPMPLMNGDKLVGYKTQISCWTCFANISEFGDTPEESMENAREKWSRRF